MVMPEGLCLTDGRERAYASCFTDSRERCITSCFTESGDSMVMPEGLCLTDSREPPYFTAGKGAKPPVSKDNVLIASRQHFNPQKSKRWHPCRKMEGNPCLKWRNEKWYPCRKMEGNPCLKWRKKLASMPKNGRQKWHPCRKMEDSRERLHASCFTYSGEWLQASRSAEIADSRERLHASRSQIAEKGSKPVASQIAGKGIKPPAVHDKILSASRSHSGKLQRETLTKLNITYCIFKQDTMPAHEARQMALEENNTRLQPPKPGVSGMVAHAYLKIFISEI